VPLFRVRRRPARIEAGIVTPPVHELVEVKPDRPRKPRWSALQRREAEARRALVQAGVDVRNVPVLVGIPRDQWDHTVRNLKFTLERNKL